MRVIDPAKPNKGGCEASTTNSTLEGLRDGSWNRDIPTSNAQMAIPPAPKLRRCMANELNHPPIRVGVRMMIKPRKRKWRKVMPLYENDQLISYSTLSYGDDGPEYSLKMTVASTHFPVPMSTLIAWRGGVRRAHLAPYTKPVISM